MKTRIILSALILIFSLSLTAQEHKISFDFGYGANGYSMKNLNEFFIDSHAIKPHNKLLDDYIKHGQQFRLGLSYQPIAAFDIGLYGAYQYSELKSSPTMIVTDDYGYPIGESKGEYKFRTEAIGAGIHATWYISDLLNFQTKENALNRFRFGIEGNGGVGFSTIISDLRTTTFL